MHELEVAVAAGALGSIDANTGDDLARLGHRPVPDQHLPDDPVHACILEMGGLTTGGVNFDAKVRRESFEPIDLFYAHIGGMDAFARGLKIAAAIRADGRRLMVKKRYGVGEPRDWRSHRGQRKFHLAGEIRPKPTGPHPNHHGRQELFENIVNQFI